MTQVAEIYTTPSARLVTAKVAVSQTNTGKDAAKTCRVISDNLARVATLAASCLMLPEEGDTVLLACLDDDSAVILAVLSRADPDAPCRLCLPTQTRLETPGNLTLTAAQGMNLHSGRDMGLRTQSLSLTAEEGRMHINRIDAVADTVRSWCRSLHSVGAQAQVMYRSLTQCLGTSRRMVEGEDETRAGSSTLIVTESSIVQAKNTLTLAEKVSRTDAGQIQLG